MALNFAGTQFAVQASNWKFPQADRAADHPPRIEADLIFDAYADYAAFRLLFSVVTWRRPLGSTTWTARPQAGHGADTLVVPRAGEGNATTYTEAYLTGLSAEASAGRAGRYFVRASWEVPA